MFACLRRRHAARSPVRVRGGLSLGRPARRTPGHTGSDPGSERFPAPCKCSEPSSLLSTVQLAATASRAALRAVTRSATSTLDTRPLTRNSAPRGGRGESSSLDQAAEVLDRSGADDTPGDPAVRADHERAGECVDGHEPVELSRDKVAGVTQAWVEKPVPLHVGLRAGRVILHVDTDELDARWLEIG